MRLRHSTPKTVPRSKKQTVTYGDGVAIQLVDNLSLIILFFSFLFPEDMNASFEVPLSNDQTSSLLPVSSAAANVASSRQDQPGAAAAVEALPAVVFHRYNWTYAENPDLPDWIFNLTAFYLFLIGCFGIVSNLSILVVFSAKTSVKGESESPIL